MQDAWRAYLELALGLTEASRRRAEQAVRDVFGKGVATAGQVQSRVEELVSHSRANRAELAKLVRYEVDRALGAVGLATAEEVAALTERVNVLERRVSAAEVARLPEPVSGAADPGVAAGRPVAKRAGSAVGGRPGRAAAGKATSGKPAISKRTTSKPPNGKVTGGSSDPAGRSSGGTTRADEDPAGADE